MTMFYFFKNDGMCKWMKKESIGNMPKYLYEPVDFEGNKVKFYLILDWMMTNTRGVNTKLLDELTANYVKTVDDLPKNAGVYITGYDGNIKELKKLQENNIPIIDSACPWVRELKRQLFSVNSNTHQCVLMIDEGHIVYECYKSIFPKDIIIVQPDNYEARINQHANGNPFHLLVYAVHRMKDAQRISDFIEANYKNNKNILDGYKKTICCWSKQGLIEEIEKVGKKKRLDEVWVVCNSTGDRSTMSIISELNECGLKYLIIKNKHDIPIDLTNLNRIGVLVAPIPLSEEGRNCIYTIREMSKNPAEVIRTIYEKYILFITNKLVNKNDLRLNEILEHFDEDSIIIFPGVKEVVPFAGNFKGIEQIKFWFTNFKDAVEPLNIDISLILSEEEYISVIIHESYRIKSTDKVLSTESVHLWELKEDNKVKLFKSHNDTLAFHQAFLK